MDRACAIREAESFQMKQLPPSRICMVLAKEQQSAPGEHQAGGQSMKFDNRNLGMSKVVSSRHRRKWGTCVEDTGQGPATTSAQYAGSVCHSDGDLKK